MHSPPGRGLNFMLFIGALRAGEITRYSMFTELFSIWVVGVPAALIGGFVLDFPVYGVYAFVLLEEAVRQSLSSGASYTAAGSMTWSTQQHRSIITDY